MKTEITLSEAEVKKILTEYINEEVTELLDNDVEVRLGGAYSSTTITIRPPKIKCVRCGTKEHADMMNDMGVCITCVAAERRAAAEGVDPA